MYQEPLRIVEVRHVYTLTWMKGVERGNKESFQFMLQHFQRPWIK